MRMKKIFSIKLLLHITVMAVVPRLLLNIKIMKFISILLLKKNISRIRDMIEFTWI